MVVFIGFIVYSVYSFNYDSKIDSQSLSATSSNNNQMDEDGIIDKIVNFFASSDTKDTKPFSLVLTPRPEAIDSELTPSESHLSNHLSIVFLSASKIIAKSLIVRF